MVTTNFFGVEHLPDEFGAGAPLTCYGLGYSELAPTMYANNSATSVSARVKGKKIVVGTTGGQATPCTGATYIQMSKLIGSVTVRKAIIGLRYEFLGLAGGTPSVFGLSPANNTTADPSFTGLFIPALVGLTDGGYYELIFDFVANTFTILLNGAIYKAAVTLSAFTAAAFKSWYWTMGQPWTYWVTGPKDVWAVSDIYSMYNTDPADDALVVPLGPITLKRLPVLSTTGAGWTPSVGNTVDALNTRRAATASLSAPKVGVAADNTPLRVKVDTSSLSFVTVRGISVKVSAVKDVAGDKTLSVAMASNGTTNASVPVTMTAGAAPLDASPGGLLTMPDGSGLTIASLSNLEVVLTPA